MANGVSMNQWISLGDRALVLAKRTDSAALLIARLTVGVLFVSTGWGKVNNLAKVTDFFTELGIPMPGFNAALASYAELVCGFLLVIGLASRLAAVPLVVTMAVAILTAKRGELHSVPDLFGFVEWTYLVILLVIFALGPGKIALDTLVERRIRAAAPRQVASS
jgi:putative oxidoreductase